MPSITACSTACKRCLRFQANDTGLAHCCCCQQYPSSLWLLLITSRCIFPALNCWFQRGRCHFERTKPHWTDIFMWLSSIAGGGLMNLQQPGCVQLHSLCFLTEPGVAVNQSHLPQGWKKSFTGLGSDLNKVLSVGFLSIKCWSRGAWCSSMLGHLCHPWLTCSSSHAGSMDKLCLILCIQTCSHSLERYIPYFFLWSVLPTMVLESQIHGLRYPVCVHIKKGRKREREQDQSQFIHSRDGEGETFSHVILLWLVLLDSATRHRWSQVWSWTEHRPDSSIPGKISLTFPLNVLNFLVAGS